MSRATKLNEAISTLILPYTYDLDRAATVEQKQTRQKVALLVIPILEKMRDNLMDQIIYAIKVWKGGG